ncbi:MAG: SDR family NAD(P)-dependent oxidoreductase [Anaerohalosphaeraceae bacterium]
MEKHDLIAIIAPAVRRLLWQGTVMPTVSFQDTLCDKKEGCLEVSIDSTGTSQQIITTLTHALAAKSHPIQCVCVPGVGNFTVHQITPSQGRVSGKIAIVTGAAQGFGLEIAQDLVAQGAYVALADINEAVAKTEADKLCGQHGPNRAMAVTMNVTSKESIQKAVAEVIKKWGGIDIFVSNAGVLKAESVKTQSEKDFDFVTQVNYKGYFLCVQAISGIMAVGHKINPSYTSDIIQINSKSGLVGSNRNGAYAGSKFGGIGLTESFALELVEDGIKVNSICPGNFFDGPLWSDPNNGLFVQYLRTGKVPGAKTLADVKKFYEDKVPMKRGCRTADVMKAIYYLVEQQYETGQAVPVTGGQVMLH